MRCVDIDEEEKKSVIYRHSEKLGIAYMMMKLDTRMVTRMVENLRVCDDFHIVMKLISRVYGRELIVKDRNQFHNFGEGACSCTDF